jgi:hypothetical protein
MDFQWASRCVGCIERRRKYRAWLIHQEIDESHQTTLSANLRRSMHSLFWIGKTTLASFGNLHEESLLSEQFSHEFGIIYDFIDTLSIGNKNLSSRKDRMLRHSSNLILRHVQSQASGFILQQSIESVGSQAQQFRYMRLNNIRLSAVCKFYCNHFLAF